MIKILQISDFHYVDTTAQKMMRQKVCDDIRRVDPDILFVTGDLHNYGKDYEPFKQYIKDLMKEGNLKTSDVFIVPGNHDIDSDLSEEAVKNRKAYIAYILSKVEKDPDSYREYKGYLTKYFEGYNRTVNEILDGSYSQDTAHLYIWNEKLNIITINTALVSDGEPHQQIIDANRLADLNPCNGLPTIVMGHHEISDFFNSHQSIIKSLMASWKVSFYTCGDSHINKQKLVDDVMCENIKIPVIVAGKGSVENTDDYSDVSYLLYEIDDSSNDVQVKLFKWDKDIKKFTQATFDDNKMFASFELRSTPKRKELAASSNTSTDISGISEKWCPPVVKGYVLIGTQGREGIKYVWQSGNTVFESVALNQKQFGNLRGQQDSEISTYATSVSSGCILQAMRMQCTFCATGNIPFQRLLPARDIALQNIFMSLYDDDCECHAYLKDNKREFSYTAQGEPGYSYSQLREAIVLTEKALLENRNEDFITRHVIYTCGTPEFLDLLMKDIMNNVFRRPIGLHFSLNAVGNVRRQIMPIDEMYPYKQVLRKLETIYQRTEGRIGKIAINLTAFNKYSYQGGTYSVNEENIKEILAEIANPDVFRINVYDYYSEKSVRGNKGNEQIEKLFHAISKQGYDVKVCHCWGDRVKSAFGMLDSSTDGLSDLGVDGQNNYQRAVKLIEKYLDT